MRQNFRPSLDAVLVHEGQFSHHPKDPGGATMRGVTQRVYTAWRLMNGKLDQSVKDISDSELEAIYYQQYYLPTADKLPSGLDYAVFDYAVNSGVGRAVQHLQEVLGVKRDGIVGNVTLAAANEQPVQRTINALCDRRLRFVQGLSTWDTFGKGWQRRIDGVRSRALEMAARGDSKSEAPAQLPAPPLPPRSPGKSIGEVMLWIVMALIAGIVALFVGGK